MLLYSAGEGSAAQPHLEQAIDIAQHLFGEAHPRVAQCHNNLGMLLYRTGNLDQAERHLKQALTI
jgi:Tfp pilus assembly protein PilF